MQIKDYIRSMGRAARVAARLMARADTGVKNTALRLIAENLSDRRARLAEANEIDLAAARKNKLDAPAA